MSDAAIAPGKSVARSVTGSYWLITGIGFMVLYVPTLYDLFTDMWSTEGQAHGPIILGLALWLLYTLYPTMMRVSEGVRPGRLASVVGWFLFVSGLFLYLIGRAVSIIPMEMGSFIVLLMSVVLIRRGGAALRVIWFPVFFMLFMIPLPGPLVSMLTLPMKMAVSNVTEAILYTFDFPISRSGVILQIGQYQLLVADACAGLQTLLTLESLGMFYMNVMRHTSAFRNVTLAVLIIPISFAANVIRVITLTLITYYWGDEAGQGFLHGFAGIVLFMSALILILAVDNLLQWLVKRRQAGAKP